MSRRFIPVLFLLFTPGFVFGMSLETATVTNKTVSLVDVYKVGLILFENRTSNTNLDYLALSLPLMLKEGVKKNTDFFVPREELLGSKESIVGERKAGVIDFRKTANPPDSIDKTGKKIKRSIPDSGYEKAKLSASLRRQLEFSSTVIRQNEQTLDEIAKKQKFHYLLFGNYSRTGKEGVVVEVHLYSAITGRTIHTFRQVYKDGQVLLNIKQLVDKMRKRMVRFTTVPLRIVTEPVGAHVYIGKLYKGKTPLHLPYTTATNHRIYLKKNGFRQLNLDVLLKPGKSYLLKRKLVRTGGVGSITIESHPPGAEVRVDLLLKGKTPLVLSNMPAGLYRISLDKEKYHRKYRRVEIVKNKMKKTHVNLQPVIKGELTTDQRVKRHRKWMNVFFWSGAGSLAAYAYFYFKREDALHQYWSGGSTSASLYNKFNNYNIASGISLGVTAGCFAASAYFLVRYMLSDDRDLGKAPSDTLPNVYATSDRPGNLLINWKF